MYYGIVSIISWLLNGKNLFAESWNINYAFEQQSMGFRAIPYAFQWLIRQVTLMGGTNNFEMSFHDFMVTNWLSSPSMLGEYDIGVISSNLDNYFICCVLASIITLVVIWGLVALVLRVISLGSIRLGRR